MAFNRNGLSRIGGAGDGGAIWGYNTGDSIADTQAASYFDEAADVLQKGDTMFITRQSGTSYCHITYVKSVSTANVVAMAAGTTVTHA